MAGTRPLPRHDSPFHHPSSAVPDTTFTMSPNCFQANQKSERAQVSDDDVPYIHLRMICCYLATHRQRVLQTLCTCLVKEDGAACMHITLLPLGFAHKPKHCVCIPSSLTPHFVNLHTRAQKHTHMHQASMQSVASNSMRVDIPRG